MDDKCKAPINDLCKPYVCNICGKMYHNILCGTFTENSSLCSGCSAKKSDKTTEKTDKKVDNIQLVVTPTQRVNVERTNTAFWRKMYLEQLLQTEDFGKKWFYQTNDDINKYMHFCFADKLKQPTMFMVQPADVTFDDLQLEVCLFLINVLFPIKHVF